MKEIHLIIRMNEGKLLTVQDFKGFGRDISSELEILGIYQNLVQLQSERLKTLMTNEKQVDD